MRERANSLPIMHYMQKGEKRKDKQEKGMEQGEVEGLRKNIKIGKSPVKGNKGGTDRKRVEAGGEDKEGFEIVIKKIKKGFVRIEAQMEKIRECKAQIKKEDLKKLWNKEKIVINKRIEELKKKMKEKREGERQEGRPTEEIGWRVMCLEERTRMLEIGKERQKKKWRKNTLIIRGIKIKEEKKETLREQVEEIFGVIGVKAKIVEINKI
ncbi:golgin subfamily A member 6-like protein 22 [Cardiocondyla obscurior]|uniref:golgin subfamily A member 6-like protein 22 n=1 Tax=Cardiocondyla obscurior TaxID=286306 RepID=UPI003965770B